MVITEYSLYFGENFCRGDRMCMIMLDRRDLLVMLIFRRDWLNQTLVYVKERVKSSSDPRHHKMDARGKKYFNKSAVSPVPVASAAG
jgi:hypothetical protein